VPEIAEVSLSSLTSSSCLRTDTPDYCGIAGLVVELHRDSQSIRQRGKEAMKQIEEQIAKVRKEGGPEGNEEGTGGAEGGVSDVKKQT